MMQIAQFHPIPKNHGRRSAATTLPTLLQPTELKHLFRKSRKAVAAQDWLIPICFSPEPRDFILISVDREETPTSLTEIRKVLTTYYSSYFYLYITQIKSSMVIATPALLEIIWISLDASLNLNSPSNRLGWRKRRRLSTWTVLGVLRAAIDLLICNFLVLLCIATLHFSASVKPTSVVHNCKVCLLRSSPLSPDFSGIWQGRSSWGTSLLRSANQSSNLFPEVGLINLSVSSWPGIWLPVGWTSSCTAVLRGQQQFQRSWERPPCRCRRSHSDPTSWHAITEPTRRPWSTLAVPGAIIV